MVKPVKITDSTYYIGVNDRRTSLFENLWPLEKGVAYNSYLIKDKKNVLIDTVEISFSEKLLNHLEDILGNEPLDYLVINHMEPDHCGAIKIVRQKYPNIKLVGNKKTFKMIESYFGITDNLHEVKEGDELEIGSTSLKFYMTPMVHWPETMMTYQTKNKMLFAGDAFGAFGSLDGGIFDDEVHLEELEPEMRRYYSNIVGKYGSPVQKALEKLASLDIKFIGSTHGPVYRTEEGIKWVIGKYDQWSRFDTEKGAVIIFGSMYGNTEDMADVIGRRLSEKGIKNITIFDSSKTHPSHILSEIFRYKAIVIGSATYSNQLHPNVESLLLKLEHIGVKNRYLGIFGSYTWAGAATKRINTFGENIGWEIVNSAVEEHCALKDKKYMECVALADAIVDKLNKDFE